MKVTNVAVSKIKPYAKNAKIHTPEKVERLAKEIQDLGFTQPIVVDYLGVIVVGHRRLLAAKSLGMTHVPVLRLPEATDMARIRAHRLFDNKDAEGGWDDKLLAEEFADLLNDLSFDVDLTGFGKDDVLELLDEDHTWVQAHQRTLNQTASEPEAEIDVPVPTDAPVRVVAGDVWTLGRHTLVCGDSSDAATVHANIGEHEGHAIVSDPPYGLGEITDFSAFISDWVSGGTGEQFVGKGGFMGKWWDRSVPPPSLWKVWTSRARPGAHALIFAGTRTQDLMAISMRMAGLEIREMIAWLHGQGFPKSLNISLAIDDAAAQWNGWGTALKPALEPITLARVPVGEKTIAANVQKWGTGGLNVEACEVTGVDASEAGRWPANVILDEEAGQALDEQTGVLTSGSLLPGHKRGQGMHTEDGGYVGGGTVRGTYGGDSGGASRFFYCAKPSTSERNAGTEHMAQVPVHEIQGRVEGSAGSKHARSGMTGAPRGNVHPTVKPLALMRYLVRLVTPPAGVVLEPFAGSGTTVLACELEGAACKAFEMDPKHCDIILARWEHLSGQQAVRVEFNDVQENA